MKKTILTGDRPTGKLHLGHYVGSLKNRVELQNEYNQFILVADVQALTDNFKKPQKVRDNILEVALDYFAVGIDPEKTNVCIQSMLPELPELTQFYLNLVSVARLERNPTIKEELKLRKFKEGVPAGFLIYPVSQASDITAFEAELVPAGEDQSPLIEQTNEIVRKFNNIYGKVLTETEILISKNARLVGVDGKNKMSKSLGNAIFLSDEPDDIKAKIMGMFTDPNHLNADDPGNIENNPVFIYLDAFGTDKTQIESMKEHYKKGGLGDVKVKNYLNEVLQEFIKPIREKRKALAKDKQQIYQHLLRGTKNARKVTSETLKKVKNALGINYENFFS